MNGNRYKITTLTIRMSEERILKQISLVNIIKLTVKYNGKK